MKNLMLERPVHVGGEKPMALELMEEMLEAALEPDKEMYNALAPGFHLDGGAQGPGERPRAWRSEGDAEGGAGELVAGARQLSLGEASAVDFDL